MEYEKKARKIAVDKTINEYLNLLYISESYKILARKNMEQFKDELIQKYQYASSETLKYAAEQRLKETIAAIIKKEMSNGNYHFLVMINTKMLFATQLSLAIDNVNTFSSLMSRLGLKEEDIQSMSELLNSCFNLSESFALCRKNLDSLQNKKTSFQNSSIPYFRRYQKEVQQNSANNKMIDPTLLKLYEDLKKTPGISMEILHIFNLRFGLLGNPLAYSHPELKRFHMSHTTELDKRVLKAVLKTEYAESIIAILQKQKYEVKRRNLINQIIEEHYGILRDEDKQSTISGEVLYDELKKLVDEETLYLFDKRFGLLGEIIHPSHPDLKPYNIQSPKTFDKKILSAILATSASNFAIEFLKSKNYNQTRSDVIKEAIAASLRSSESELQTPIIEETNAEKTLGVELYLELKNTMSEQDLFLFDKRYGLVGEIASASSLRKIGIFVTSDQIIDRILLEKALLTHSKQKVIDFISTKDYPDARKKEIFKTIDIFNTNSKILVELKILLVKFLTTENYEQLLIFLMSPGMLNKKGAGSTLFKEIFLIPELRKHIIDYFEFSDLQPNVINELRSSYDQSEIIMNVEASLVKYQTIIDDLSDEENIKYIKVLILAQFLKLDSYYISQVLAMSSDDYKSSLFKKTNRSFAEYCGNRSNFSTGTQMTYLSTKD